MPPVTQADSSDAGSTAHQTMSSGVPTTRPSGIRASSASRAAPSWAPADSVAGVRTMPGEMV
ncbi:hypothetical protein J2X68_001961 [Streptomyces sp. 3330]|nr:hypothetical protein [Streptomyces sp. 3330]MDR6975277.1 hypothetical protein [Streptomyces sp. 3330]